MALSAALAGAAATHIGSGPTWAADGDTLTIRDLRDIKILDPITYVGGMEQTVMEACLPTLARFKAGDEWGWEPSDFVDTVEQRDDLTIAFRLKPGIEWSNGFGELSAEDVKYSLERYRERGNGKDALAAMDRVEVSGPLEGTIHLKYPFAPIWVTALCYSAGFIVCKKAVEALPDQTYTTDMPATCGPYVVSEWVPQQRLVLTVNPAWKGAKPGYARVVLIPIEDERAAELAFEAGELDFTKVSVTSLARLQASPPAGAKLLAKPSLRWTWLGMNVEHPNLQDIKVRQAIQHTIDVDMIIAGAYAGMTPRATGIIPPGMIGHRDAPKIARPDLDRARQLLAEAGVPNGFKTTIQLINRQEMLDIGQIVAANLAQVGIDVEIKPLDGGVFWDLGLESKGDAWKTIELYVTRFGELPDPSAYTKYYVPEQIGEWNWERWNSPEFGALHKQAMEETDLAKRDQLYKTMQDMMEDSGAYVFITHDVNCNIYRDTVAPALRPDGNTIDLPRFAPA